MVKPVCLCNLTKLKCQTDILFLLMDNGDILQAILWVENKRVTIDRKIIKIPTLEFQQYLIYWTLQQVFTAKGIS